MLKNRVNAWMRTSFFSFWTSHHVVQRQRRRHQRERNLSCSNRHWTRRRWWPPCVEAMIRCDDDRLLLPLQHHWHWLWNCLRIWTHCSRRGRVRQPRHPTSAARPCWRRPRVGWPRQRWLTLTLTRSNARAFRYNLRECILQQGPRMEWIRARPTHDELELMKTACKG
jgi:hypothetical protein